MFLYSKANFCQGRHVFPERCSLKYESSTRIMANRAKLRKKETEVETFV
jgi:hypothetical protein